MSRPIISQQSRFPSAPNVTLRAPPSQWPMHDADVCYLDLSLSCPVLLVFLSRFPWPCSDLVWFSIFCFFGPKLLISTSIENRGFCLAPQICFLSPPSVNCVVLRARGRTNRRRGTACTRAPPKRKRSSGNLGYRQFDDSFEIAVER